MRPILARLLLPVVVTLVVLAGSSLPLGTAHAQQPAAQQLEDVVYLKDGSIIRGIIIEQRPGESVLIRTRDGNQFRYQMNQIEKLTKEAPVRAAVPQPEAVPAPAVAVVRPNPKSPGVAALLSILIPGAGQVYNGHPLAGLGYFAMTGLSYSLYVKALLEDKCFVDAKCGNATFYLGSALFWYVASIWSAASDANSINRKAQSSASLSVRPWIEVARAPKVPGDSSASRTISRPAESRLQVGILRLRF